MAKCLMCYNSLIQHPYSNECCSEKCQQQWDSLGQLGKPTGTDPHGFRIVVNGPPDIFLMDQKCLSFFEQSTIVD